MPTKASLLSREVLPHFLAFAALVAATLAVDVALHLLGAVWVGRYLGIPGVLLIVGSFAYSLRKRKLIKLAWMGLTGFSSMPLRVSSAVGLLLSVVALGYGIHVVEEYLFHAHAVPGWPTIVASIMFFSGVQLLFIGILGEYLARVYDEVKGRPIYVVADLTPSAGSSDAMD